MAAILAAILEKKVDEDAPGTGPMLLRENRVKIRCRLGGEGGRTHTHTHTQDSEKSPEFTPNGPLQAMNGCVGIIIIFYNYVCEVAFCKLPGTEHSAD